MTRAGFGGSVRSMAVLLAGSALAACGSIAPQYAIDSHVAPQPSIRSASPPASGARARGTMAPYQVGGIWYVPREQPNYDETGIASWYGDAFNMKATATGEIFDMNQFSAAHTTLPIPSMVEVTNLDNGRKMTVRVNDRGPFVGGRILDLSRAAAHELGYDRAGTAHVRVRYVGPAPLAGPDAGVRYAQAAPSARLATSTASFSRRPADEEIFVADDNAPPTATVEPVTPLVAPPKPVSVTSLASLPEVRPTSSAQPGVSGAGFQTDGFHEDAAFRIQAGAFGDQENARRAVSQLATLGQASIDPFQRGGMTLYRVTLPGPSDEAEAYAVRDKVAAIGFADARVIRAQ